MFFLYFFGIMMAPPIVTLTRLILQFLFLYAYFGPVHVAVGYSAYAIGRL